MGLKHFIFAYNHFKTHIFFLSILWWGDLLSLDSGQKGGSNFKGLQRNHDKCQRTYYTELDSWSKARGSFLQALFLLLEQGLTVFQFSVCLRKIISRPLSKIGTIPRRCTTQLDFEVIEVDKLDEGNISVGAKNKRNNGRLS